MVNPSSDEGPLLAPSFWNGESDGGSPLHEPISIQRYSAFELLNCCPSMRIIHTFLHTPAMAFVQTPLPRPGGKIIVL